MKQSRRAIRVWLPAFALAAVMLWLGCEQKGDISPTGTNRQVITFLDTVFVDPPVVAPGGTAAVNAHVLNESNEPAAHEDVRFSVSRGLLANNRTDTTIKSDAYGWARTQFTVPDSGDVLVRTELLRMAEIRSNLVHISSTPGGEEGLISIWVESDTLFADNGVSRTHVYARLRNDAHNPMVGAVVHFSSSIGAITSSAVTDSMTGTAIASLVSTTEAGVATVTAWHGDDRDSTQVSFLQPAAAGSIVVSVARPTLNAGQDSTSVTAYVYDTNHLPIVDNTVVFFAATLGSLSNLTARTLGGMASVTLHSSPTTGPGTVTATTGGTIVGSADILVVPGPTASIIVTSTSDTLFADNASQATVTALVRDAYGNPVAQGTTVTFTAEGGTVTSAATTGPDGRASATFRAGLATGPATVTAAEGSARGVVNIYLRSTIAASVSLSVNPLHLLADGVSQADLRAAVLDAQGRPVSDGTPVTFSSGIGVITGASSPFTVRSDRPEASRSTDWAGALGRGAKRPTARTESMPSRKGHNGSPTTSLFTTTTTGGYASAVLVSPTQVGPDTIGVLVQTLSDTRVVTYVSGPAAIVTVTPTDAQLPADGVSSTTVNCRVTDSYGNPVSGGVAIEVSATLGTVIPPAGFTGADGVFSTTLYTSRQSGICGVVATANSATGYGQVIFTVPDVSSVVVTGNTPSVYADGVSEMILTASALDDRGQPVRGAGISWQAEAGIGHLTVGTTITDSLGHATATFRSGASTVDASQLVHAASGTHTGDFTVQLVGISLSAWTEMPELPADGTSTTNANVLVRETTSGIAIPDATVRFAASMGTIPQSATTNSSGIATAVYRAGTQEGDVVITGVYGDTLRTTAGLRLSGTQPAAVSLSAQSDTLRADGIAVDTITAYVADAVGHALANVEVHFSTSVGNIAPSRTTDANGYSRVAFTSSQTGTAQITATVGELTDNYTVYLIPGPAASIGLEFSPNSVGVRGSGRNETLLCTATVRDANNNPVVDGTAVYFNINNSPGGGDYLSTTGAVSTINGRATVSYSSGTVSGSARIRAVCNTVSAVSTEILIYAGPPYMEDVNNPCQTSHLSLAADPCNMFGMDLVGDSVTLLALVGDRYNNPVTEGTAVYFTTSGGVITTATGYTDAQGFARVTLFSGNPLPTVSRWLNTLTDPNLSGAILCNPTPTQPGMAKVMATTAGVAASGDSVVVWASTDVVFNYRQPVLEYRGATVNGNDTLRTLYIGENALITVATYDPNFWPLVAGSTISFSANLGSIYPESIEIGCPSDTSFTVSFFNNLTLQDQDGASPVLITVDTRQGDAYTFTETFTLRAAMPPGR